MNKKNNFKSLIYLLVLGVICSILTVVTYLQYIQEKSIHTIVEQTSTPHNLIKNEINIYKSKKERMLRMLSQSSHMIDFLKNFNSRSDLEDLLVNIVKSDNDYMQLRFLDTKGVEVIRVDQNKNGKIELIKDNTLQNKSKRDYFIDFMKLEKDEVGFSKFDLNIENEKIETPFNPTLRIGFKVYLNEELKGILIMNLYMEDWIHQIFSVNSFKISIIGANNYYKTHYDKNLRWSKYQALPQKAKNIPNWQTLDYNYYILNEDTIGRALNLFNENVLISYKMPTNIKAVLIENISTLLTTMLVAFLFIFGPIALIIRKYIHIIKESSKYQHNIFNNMFDAMIIIDQKAIIHEVNKQAEQLFGYEAQEIIGKNINTLIPEPHHGKHDGYVKNYNKEGRTIIGNNREIEAICKDGTLVPVSLAVTKMTINNHSPLFIGVARDLREIKQLEDKNKQQENLLHHQSKLAAMGEMIGAIAHQWRQPLNELGIRIQNLKYQYPTGQVDEEFINTFIQKNKKTIAFMSDTIDDFRDFFRIDKEKKEFQVKESINETISMLSAQLNDNNIILNIEGDEFKYLGFKNEFKQVIMNLINNAKDALITNSIENAQINIKINNNQIKIEDNAGGIPKDIIHRIFEPYYTTKEEGKGTGMGLYMSKMIIEDNMNSIISVKNNKHGAVFTIDLK